MSDRAVRQERSHWRDEELSLRHRFWGFDCPAVDIDFLMVEYNHMIPVALIDYKLRTLESRDPDRRSASHQAIGRLASKYSDGALPYLVVFYSKSPWLFRLIPMNDEADRRLKCKHHVLSEQQYVKWLYKLRGMPLPLQIARHLDTYFPQKQASAESESLSTLVANAEQHSLFEVSA